MLDNCYCQLMLAFSYLIYAGIYRLVTVSGRTEEGVKAQLEAASQGGRGLEMLLHDLATVSPATHGYRGYAVTGASRPMQEIAVSIGLPYRTKLASKIAAF